MHIHYKKTIFLLALIIMAFGVFFLFLYYSAKHKLIVPAAPIAGYTTTADQMPGPNAYLYSFEHGEASDLRSNVRAHTGKYSTIASGRLSYSLVVKKNIDSALLTLPTRIAISAWLFIAGSVNDPEAQLAVTVTDKKNKERYSASIRIKGNSVPANHWFKVSGSFDIKDIAFNPDDQLNVFLWNQCDSEIFMDDLLVICGIQKVCDLKMAHPHKK
ncbi:MAG: hypothetical protein WCM76_09925 [Bacteroidota bacterium]